MTGRDGPGGQPVSGDRRTGSILQPAADGVRASLGAASSLDGVGPLVLPTDGVADVRLEGPDPRGRARLLVGAHAPREYRILMIDPAGAAPPRRRGVRVREVVVDGWRVEVEVEPARRAELRERATRGGHAAGGGGPTEVRAIIPGRIVGVSVASGDRVVAGQQLLVVEAMKMQNELRAPRDGTIERVAVGSGQTIEVGDLLLVLAGREATDVADGEVG